MYKDAVEALKAFDKEYPDIARIAELLEQRKELQLEITGKTELDRIRNRVNAANGLVEVGNGY